MIFLILIKRILHAPFASGTTKHENEDSTRGGAPLAGGMGVSPISYPYPPRLGGRGLIDYFLAKAI